MSPRRMDMPEPGWWLVQLGKGTPRVPACIEWHETTVDPCYSDNAMEGTRYRYLSASIAGEVVPLDAVWLRKGEPITAAEYRFRCADLAHAKAHRPDDPLSQPRRAIDLMTAPIPF